MKNEFAMYLVGFGAGTLILFMAVILVMEVFAAMVAARVAANAARKAAKQRYWVPGRMPYTRGTTPASIRKIGPMVESVRYPYESKRRPRLRRAK